MDKKEVKGSSPEDGGWWCWGEERTPVRVKPPAGACGVAFQVKSPVIRLLAHWIREGAKARKRGRKRETNVLMKKLK